MTEPQTCALCGLPTNHAGANTLYTALMHEGPLCERCFRDAQLADVVTAARDAMQRLDDLHRRLRVLEQAQEAGTVAQ